MSKRRIHRELQSFITHCQRGCNAEQVDDDPLHWQAVILGPDGSDYEGGIFYLNVRFPCDYPVRPPQVHFLTPILHPNVSFEYGKRCLRHIYAKNWSPACTIAKLLIEIRGMLSHPNPHDPLDVSLSNLYLTDRKEYEAQVRKHTKDHAILKKQSYSLISSPKEPQLQLVELTVLCRMSIRNRLREKNPRIAHIDHYIKQLPLPKRITNFLHSDKNKVE